MALTFATETDIVGVPPRTRLVAGVPPVLWLAWLATRFYGLLAIHNVFPYNRTFPSTTDIATYFSWSHGLWHGAVPYRDFPIIYPPGILPFLALPSTSFAAYKIEFFVAALLVDAYVLVALYRSGRRVGAAVWIAAAPLLGPIFWSRLDVFVAAALVAAILAIEKGHFRWAGVFIGYAALLKLWPIVLVVLVLRSVPRTAWRRLLVASGLTFVLPIALFAASGGARAIWYVITLQSDRGVEIESVFAAPLFALVRLGHSVPIMESASLEFDGHVGWLLASISTFIFATAIVCCGWRALRNRPPVWTPASWLVMLVAVVLLTSKVLSPQYLVWAAAAVALYVDGAVHKRAVLGATGILLVMTQLQFPFMFVLLVQTSPEALPLSVLHALSVIAFAAIVYRSVRASNTRPLDGTGSDVTERQSLEVPLPV